MISFGQHRDPSGYRYSNFMHHADRSSPRVQYRALKVRGSGRTSWVVDAKVGNNDNWEYVGTARNYRGAQRLAHEHFTATKVSA